MCCDQRWMLVFCISRAQSYRTSGPFVVWVVAMFGSFVPLVSDRQTGLNEQHRHTDKLLSSVWPVFINVKKHKVGLCVPYMDASCSQFVPVQTQRNPNTNL